MVGLSVILESCRDLSANKTPRVICKGSMIKPPSTQNSGFLDCCFLCYDKLLPCKDIYMYKGDKAFCSVECRCRQMFMDEEESNSNTVARKGCTSSRKYNCSLLAAIKAPEQLQQRTTPSPRSGKGPKTRSNAFAC